MSSQPNNTIPRERAMHVATAYAAAAASKAWSRDQKDVIEQSFVEIVGRVYDETKVLGKPVQTACNLAVDAFVAARTDGTACDNALYALFGHLKQAGYDDESAAAFAAARMGPAEKAGEHMEHIYTEEMRSKLDEQQFAVWDWAMQTVACLWREMCLWTNARYRRRGETPTTEEELTQLSPHLASYAGAYPRIAYHLARADGGLEASEGLREVSVAVDSVAPGVELASNDPRLCIPQNNRKTGYLMSVCDPKFLAARGLTVVETAVWNDFADGKPPVTLEPTADTDGSAWVQPWMTVLGGRVVLDCPVTVSHMTILQPMHAAVHPKPLVCPGACYCQQLLPLGEAEPMEEGGCVTPTATDDVGFP